jgi:hypothetical protein
MACDGSFEKSDDGDRALSDAMECVLSKLPGYSRTRWRTANSSATASGSIAAAADGAPATEAAAGSSRSDAAANSSHANNSSALGSRDKSAFRLFEELSGNLKADTLPLHRAVAYGHKLVVELLLMANADPNLRCCHGYSPLLQVRAAPYSQIQVLMHLM